MKRLFKGYVADEDIDAIEVIYKSASPDEKVQIRASVNISDLSSVGQRARMRTIFAS